MRSAANKQRTTLQSRRRLAGDEGLFMSVRRVLLSSTAVFAASALMITGISLVGPAAAAAAVSAAAVPAAAPNAAPQVVRDGRWVIATDAVGTTIAWDSSATSLYGSARPEFLLDGQPLGPARVLDGGKRLALFVPGLDSVSPSRLSVMLGGRRIDVPRARARLLAVAPTPAPTPVPLTDPAQPKDVLKPDPGIFGTFQTESIYYTRASIKVDEMPVNIEVVGQVIAPIGAPGKRPVVLFLHGRHVTCYGADGVSIDWPCGTGFKAIPSVAGYRYIQRLLASRGYVTVSIAANGVNGQDWGTDAGANARSVLVRHHLKLLAGWNTTAGPGDLAKLLGKMDLQKVMLVGHSRGGEGVARASIDAGSADPYRIKGQVLIAPTDFGRQVSTGVPTTVLLPYCDGDVSDLQGQQFVDQWRGLVDGDNSLVTAALVFGANHNYFNTQWTPGIALAPSNDDWSESADATCGTDAPGRLTAKGQRDVGAAYVSAAADAYLRAFPSAAKLLDGTPIRAESAGKAVVYTATLGGKRTPVLTDPATATLTASTGAKSIACVGISVGPESKCIANGAASSAHWFDGDVPPNQAWATSWTAANQTMKAALATSVNLRTLANLDLRAFGDPRVSESVFRVVLTDAAGKTAISPVDLSLRPLPGSGWVKKAWAQTVRVPLAGFSGVDLGAIKSVAIRAVSKTGGVVVLDAFGSNSGLATTSISPWSVPRFNVSLTKVVLPGDDTVRTVNATISITGTVVKPARLWLRTGGGNGKPAHGVVEVVVAPGATSVSVPISAAASSVYSSSTDYFAVNAYPSRNAKVSKWAGGIQVATTVPAPTLIVDSPDVTVAQGQPIVWTLRFSEPTHGWYWPATGVAPAESPEATTKDLLAPWVTARSANPTLANGDPAPLSQAQLQINVLLDQFVTTGTIEIPTARTSTATVARKVAIEIPPDGAILTSPVRLTASILPPPV